MKEKIKLFPGVEDFGWIQIILCLVVLIWLASFGHIASPIGWSICKGVLFYIFVIYWNWKLVLLKRGRAFALKFFLFVLGESLAMVFPFWLIERHSDSRIFNWFATTVIVSLAWYLLFKLLKSNVSGAEKNI